MFRSKKPQHNAKTFANTTDKHNTTTNHQKQKFAPENGSRQRTLRRRKTVHDEKAKMPTKKKQKRTAFPFVQLAERESKQSRDSTVRRSKHKVRDSTVASPASFSGPYFWGLREEVGGAYAAQDGPSGMLFYALPKDLGCPLSLSLSRMKACTTKRANRREEETETKKETHHHLERDDEQKKGEGTMPRCSWGAWGTGCGTWACPGRRQHYYSLRETQTA